jgi:RimJ/RimL family protein N-acetyltransferase
MSCVVAATDTPNQRSVRVMQRLGMFFSERREYHGLDTVFYALAREEFKS